MTDPVARRACVLFVLLLVSCSRLAASQEACSLLYDLPAEPSVGEVRDLLNAAEEAELPLIRNAGANLERELNSGGFLEESLGLPPGFFVQSALRHFDDLCQELEDLSTGQAGERGSDALVEFMRDLAGGGDEYDGDLADEAVHYSLLAGGDVASAAETLAEDLADESLGLEPIVELAEAYGSEGFSEPEELIKRVEESWGG